MTYLILFVVVPVLMLFGLWLAGNDKQVRGVMVTGASILLALSIYLVFDFIGARHAGNTDPMLFGASIDWFRPLHIKFATGVDGISVVMILLSAVIVFTGTFASWQMERMYVPLEQVTSNSTSPAARSTRVTVFEYIVILRGFISNS